MRSSQYEFIPEEVFSCLVRQWGSNTQLRRLLSADWVSTWKGWSDAKEGLVEFEEDALMRNEIVRDCVNRFCLIVLDNVVLRAKSDEE